MSVQQYKMVSYGLTQPLNLEATLPIVSLRDPGAGDKAQLGSLWINKTSNAFWILTSIVNNAAHWESGSGGAGVFTSLTVTGNSDLQGAVTAGDGLTVNGSPLVSNTGLEVNLGDIVVVAGGVIIEEGDLTLNVGDVNVDAGSLTTGRGILVQAVGITIDAGDLFVNSGNATISEGALEVTAGDVTVGAGDLVVTAGNISAGAEISAGTILQVGGGTGPTIRSGAGSPNGVVAASHGSFYLNTAGSGVNDRLWVNTNGGTVWTFVTTGA